MSEHTAPEARTIDVDVQDIDTRGRTLHGYAAVYNVESDDLGGFREKIAQGAFASVLDSDVRALLNHDPSQVLGRTRSGTLRLRDEQRGLRFEVDLPDSPLGDNVREAVRRGDIDGASFRFVVGRDSWDGDLRTVEQIKELKDVTVATFGAYPAASVELRTRDAAEGRQEDENTMDNDTENRTEERPAAGSLRVEDRASVPEMRTLTETFRERGFPGESATVSWGEYRSLTYGGGTVLDLNPVRRDGAPLGYDTQWAHPAFAQVAVDSGVTSVQVLSQSSRTLPAGTAVIRDIDAVTAKPEVVTEAAVATVELSQVAAIESGIPNILIEQDGLASLVEQDLRLAINEGLDSLVLTGVATAGTLAEAGTLLLNNIRKSITALMTAGYAPDTVIVPPATAEAIDVLQTAGPEAHYVFGAGRFAPGSLFGLNVRTAKDASEPAVLDSSAFGKLYVSPLSLERFEEDAGSTNKSTVRLEGHAAFGVERAAAAVRIT
jgi:HK97 family phage prohead protease